VQATGSSTEYDPENSSYCKGEGTEIAQGVILSCKGLKVDIKSEDQHISVILKGRERELESEDYQEDYLKIELNERASERTNLVVEYSKPQGASAIAGERIMEKMLIYINVNKKDFSGRIELRNISIIDEMDISLIFPFKGGVYLSEIEAGSLRFTLQTSDMRGVGNGLGEITVKKSRIEELIVEEHMKMAGVQADKLSIPRDHFFLSDLRISDVENGTMRISANIKCIEIKKENAKNRMEFRAFPITIHSPEGSEEEIYYPANIEEVSIEGSSIKSLDVSSGARIRNLRITPAKNHGNEPVKVDNALLSSSFTWNRNDGVRWEGGFLNALLKDAEFNELRVSFDTKKPSGETHDSGENIAQEEALFMINGAKISEILTIEAKSERPSRTHDLRNIAHPYLVCIHNLEPSKDSKSESACLSLKGVDMSRALITDLQLDRIELIDCLWDKCEMRGIPRYGRKSLLGKVYSFMMSKVMSKGVFLPSTIAMLIREGVLGPEELPDEDPFRAVRKLIGSAEDSPSPEEFKIDLKDITTDSIRKVNSKIREFMETSLSQFEISGKMFIGEMKASRYVRKGSLKHMSYKLFSLLYDIISAYGESFVRPLIFLLIISAMPTLQDLGAITASGLARSHIAAPAALLDVLSQIIIKYLTYILSIVMFFYGIEPHPENILLVFFKFMGAILLGLEFIALRRAFERRFWR